LKSLSPPVGSAKTNRAFSVAFDFDQLPEEQDKLLVSGNEELLLTAIKNIIINGCKYSESSTQLLSLAYRTKK
jgi:hypothetical protein